MAIFCETAQHPAELLRGAVIVDTLDVIQEPHHVLFEHPRRNVRALVPPEPLGCFGRHSPTPREDCTRAPYQEIIARRQSTYFRTD